MALHQISLVVNGHRHTADVPPRLTLVDFLRDQLLLTGTHTGCEHGVCGACSILIDGKVVRSCLTSVQQASGRAITTLEGLGTPDKPDPIQAAFISEQAAQCGYCTNGMIMATKSLLSQTPKPTLEQIKQGLAGNLCRCGTHTRIVRAVMRAAQTA